MLHEIQLLVVQTTHFISEAICDYRGSHKPYTRHLFTRTSSNPNLALPSLPILEAALYLRLLVRAFQTQPAWAVASMVHLCQSANECPPR
jgi:hypothetical protein